MKLSTAIFILTAGMIFSGCSSVKVTSDFEKSTDFSQYETYSFLGWQQDSDQIMNDLNKKRMRDAFQEEFKKRNISFVEEGGDMAVTLYIVVSQETSVTAYTNYYGGYGGRGRYSRGGRGWGGGHASTTYSENDYLKGTMVVDVFDEKTGDMIWQGVAAGTVSEKAEKREKSIPKHVGALMAKFPVSPAK